MGDVHERATPDGRFTYLEAGPPDAPPLVFGHGIGGGARLWTRQLADLGGEFRAIAWNMPGYGGAAPIEKASIDGYGRALAAFVAALGLADPILIGHSIGGMVVQAYLADRMGPCAGAVLAQTSAAFGSKDPRWAADFVRDRMEPLDAGATMAELADENVAGLLGDDPDPDGVALARSVFRETPEAAYRASTLALVGFDRRDALARIAVPTLLVAGSRDEAAPAKTMRKMADAIPGSAYLCLEGCGHMVMSERPRELTAALRDFARTVAGRQRAA